jgi:hypothetical protein
MRSILMLPEGLKGLYGREDNLILPKLKYPSTDDIKLRPRAVMNSLDRIYHDLVDIRSKTLLLDEEYISESIGGLCHLITMLSIQENEILKSYINKVFSKGVKTRLIILTRTYTCITTNV